MIVRADSFNWVPLNVKHGSVDLIVTDPPYGGIIDEEWDRKWNYGDQILMTEMIVNSLKPGGTAYVWGGIGTHMNRIFFRWLSQVEEMYPDLRIHDLITWRKRRAYGTKTRMLFVREECVVLVKGDKPETFNVPYLETLRGYAGYNPDYPALSPHYRRTNVWDDVNELFRGKIHPTEKPVRLSEIMIETSSNPGDLVLDMFAGSGNVGVAAKKLGREYILIEKSDCPMRIRE